MIEQLKRWIWWPARDITGVFHLLPLLAAVILFLLLTRPGQLQELYLSYIEKPELLPIVCAVLSFTLLSAALMIAHYSLSAERIRIVFAPAGGAQDDVALNHLQRAWAFILALVPWAGLALGLYWAGGHLGTVGHNLEAAIDPLLPQRGMPESDAVLASVKEVIAGATGFAYKAWLASFFVAAAGLGVVYLLDRASRGRHSRTLKRTTILAMALLFVGFGLVAWRGGDALGIELYRWIGPLAVTALAALFLFSAAAILAYLSQKAGLPALSLVLVITGSAIILGASVGAIAYWLAIATLAMLVLAFLSRQWPVAGLAALVCALAYFTVVRENRGPPVPAATVFDQPTPKTKEALAKHFAEWLKVRRPQGDGEKYPVFIIAVQGGGIYAAVASSQFLSVLQDRCPAFAQHVFAISAVSGGAIGAAVFQALTPRLQQPAPAGCGLLSASTERSLKNQTEEIMLDDHFSPIVASIVPDLLGASLGRSRAVEESFIHSVERNAKEAAEHLRGNFSNHWRDRSLVPALMLNATWAETGYRVVFAPFVMGEGDGTVYSLSDPDALKDVSLMRAAVVSARFPGILPPYAIRRQSGQDEKRWNFVDGGYADASGAATAIDLYQMLNDAGKGLNADIKVIVLSGDKPQHDPKKIEGTEFGDLIAPINAIMKVRGLLAAQSVRRACTSFKKLDQSSYDRCPMDENLAESTEWKIKVVELQDELFSLPLGWKISKTTFDIVSLLMGRSELCTFEKRPGQATDQSEAPIKEDPQKDPRKDVSTRVLRNNSCVLKAVEVALGAVDTRADALP